jgi:Tat protein translocase TatB subunit
MNIMGMGWQEMMLILVGALIIFGPTRLPEVAGQLGKAMRDLRKMTAELTGELERTAGVGDIKKAVQSELAGIQKEVNSATAGVNRELNKATSSVNSSVQSAAAAAKGTSSTTTSSTTAAAKPATSTSAKSTTSTSTSSAPTAPKVSKKDPLADLFALSEGEPATAPVAAASNGGATQPASVDTLDALSRARQRRVAAGYNKRPS